MQILSVPANDYVLLIGRCCLAAVFAVSALSKFRRDPAEVKVLANLHIPAPASVEMLVGVCEVIGALALVLGAYAQIASILLALFMIVVSFAVLTFWSPGDLAPVRAQKLNGFVANIAIVGGLIYVIAAGSGRLSLIR
jgi:putative oxidoreductase